jgi:hypothetical protein
VAPPRLLGVPCRRAAGASALEGPGLAKKTLPLKTRPHLALWGSITT